jgi:hypothetical protein
VVVVDDQMRFIEASVEEVLGDPLCRMLHDPC